MWIHCCYCHWNGDADHWFHACSLWTTSVMANSCLRCADQIAGLIMLRLHTSGCICTWSRRKFLPWGQLKKFSIFLSVNNQTCCIGKASPERRTSSSKKGWGRSVTKMKTATKGDQSSSTANYPMLGRIPYNGWNNFKMFTVPSFGNCHKTNRNRCCTCDFRWEKSSVLRVNYN